MLFPLLIALGTLVTGTGPGYQGVVVDATTRKPLPAVTVREVEQGTTRLTDETGAFTFSSVKNGTVHLKLTSVGYAPADVTRSLSAAGRRDTLLMIPAAQALPDVTVRPKQEVTVTPFESKTHKANGYFLIPSVSMAVHLAGLPNQATGTISKIQLQLKPTTIRQGSIRIRLVAAPAGGFESVPTGPDLLPAPIEVKAAELAVAPKGLLSVDVSAHDIALPSAGVLVIVDGLANDPQQQYVTISGATGKASPLLVTGTDVANPATYETSKLNEYPQIESADSYGTSRTWFLGSNGKGWRLYKSQDKKKTRNTLVSLVVVAD